MCCFGIWSVPRYNCWRSSSVFHSPSRVGKTSIHQTSMISPDSRICFRCVLWCTYNILATSLPSPNQWPLWFFLSLDRPVYHHQRGSRGRNHLKDHLLVDCHNMCKVLDEDTAWHQREESGWNPTPTRMDHREDHRSDDGRTLDHQDKSRSRMFEEVGLPSVLEEKAVEFFPAGHSSFFAQCGPRIDQWYARKEAGSSTANCCFRSDAILSLKVWVAMYGDEQSLWPLLPVQLHGAFHTWWR